MTDPAFAIKNEVHRLIEVQIETLRKASSLTPSELDEYHLRSVQLANLCKQLDSMARKQVACGIHGRPERALILRGPSRRSRQSSGSF